MVGIIGKKVGMTRVVDGDGRVVACTVVQSEGCVVTQIKTRDKDTYEAVQLGYGERIAKRVTRPREKHCAKAGVAPQHKLVEFRDFWADFCREEGQELKLGQKISPTDVFTEGEYIDVVGTAKGKGFQGVVKRHGFGGVGQRTHGQHNRERAPGAIGACSTPSRVFKGMRMAGRTGGQRVQVDNLRVMKIIPEHNLIVVSGAVPGAKNGYLILKK